MRQGHVGHAFARAELQRFPFARVQYAFQLGFRKGCETVTDRLFGPVGGVQACTMALAYPQKPLEEFFRFGTAADTEEIDDLDEDPRMPLAGAAYRFNQFAQAGDVAVVTDAQQRPAGDVAYARCFDDYRPGASTRKALVPLQHVCSDNTVFVRAPRHHRRHPGALLQFERADARRAEESRCASFLCRGHPAGVGMKLDSLRRLPHACAGDPERCGSRLASAMPGPAARRCSSGNCFKLKVFS